MQDIVMVPRSVLRRDDISDGAKLLFGVLFANRVPQIRYVSISISGLSEVVKVTKKTIQNRMKELERAKLIEVVSGKSRGEENLYYFPKKLLEDIKEA
jgi:hypothetical protein